MFSRNVKRVLEDPGYAVYVLFVRYLKINLVTKVFSKHEDYRSDLENGRYYAAVKRALLNENAFKQFRRSYAYREILEHVSKEQGELYVSILKERNDPIFLKGAKDFLLLDTIGNPRKNKFEDLPMLASPTTIRYLKVASDLYHLFGKIWPVAEIGCGFGGQALVNDQLLKVSSATLIDLPLVNNLISRYLENFLLNGSYNTRSINELEIKNYDLVISNYAFSELPKEVQTTYVKKVLSKSKRGYLIMNSGIGGARSEGKLTIDELRNLLPNFKIYKEEPLTEEHNYLIVWGHRENNKIAKYFR